MVSTGWTQQAYEKASSLNSVADSYPSVARFTEHVQLKGGRPRTVEAYRMMIRLPARHAPFAPERGLVVRPGWMVFQLDGFASIGVHSR
jgi:hypothetical protein